MPEASAGIPVIFQNAIFMQINHVMIGGIFLLCVVYGLQRSHFIKIYFWKRRLRIPTHLYWIQQVSADLDGFALSKAARQTEDAMEYVYGETDLTAFAALVGLIPLSADSVFYDLGSGTGKLVLFMAMLFPIKKSCGIELFSSLHQAALLQKMRLSECQHYHANMEKVDYIQDSFLNTDLTDANIIYINASACIGETWLSLNQKLKNLPRCQTIITTTKPLSILCTYKLTHTTWVQMSWGNVQAFIHTRREHVIEINPQGKRI